MTSVGAPLAGNDEMEKRCPRTAAENFRATGTQALLTARRLGLVFGVSWLVFLVALTPLRWALGISDVAALGLSADDVSGTVWSGQLEGAVLSGSTLGDVDAALAPLALVTGTLRLTLRSAQSMVTLVEGRRRGFADVDLVLDLDSLGVDFPFRTTLYFEDTTVIFSRDRCVQAQGQIRAISQVGNADGLQLAGDWACANNAAEARLSGESAGTRFAATMRVAADGRYTLTARVRSSDPAVDEVLRFAGFQEGPDGFERVNEGSLRL